VANIPDDILGYLRRVASEDGHDSEAAGLLLKYKRQPEPLLGLATTRELLAEISARIEVDGANGGGGLDYRTVGGR